MHACMHTHTDRLNRDRLDPSLDDTLVDLRHNTEVNVVACMHGEKENYGTKATAKAVTALSMLC